MWAQTFSLEHELPVVILRPFNTFGPRESLPYFIPEMIRQCIKGPTVRVGSLETSRDFTYVEDTASAVILALETQSLEGEVINIGSCKSWNMREILNIIKKMIDVEGKNVTVEESRLRPNDVKKLIADNTKARKLLGWKPATVFKEGLRKTIDWYISNDKMWGYEIHGWRWRF